MMAEAANRRLSRLIAFASLVGAGYYWMAGGEYTRARLSTVTREVEERAALVERREAELETLRAWADSLASEPWAIERVARERYGYVREGEVMVRFVQLGGEPAPAIRP